MGKARTKTSSTSKKASTPYSRTAKSVQQGKDTKITKKKKTASFSWFLKVYKGLDDWHIPIFKDCREFTGAKKVLYPGSDKHITASLCFPDVVYVDTNKKVEPVFKDQAVLEWVHENKMYKEEPTIRFLCKDFNTVLAKEGSFDLMISASAGIVSEPCSKYLKPGGHFLVSDAHFDARTTFLRPDFTLVGAFDKETGKILTNKEELDRHFHTTSGLPISKEQVDESIKKPKNRRSFKLQKETWFYLFKKI